MKFAKVLGDQKKIKILPILILNQILTKDFFIFACFLKSQGQANLQELKNVGKYFFMFSQKLTSNFFELVKI